MIVTDVIGVVGLGLGLLINLYSLYASRFIVGVAVGLNSALVDMIIVTIRFHCTSKNTLLCR